MRKLLVLAVFLLSGSAGLIYQVVWMRKLTLVLGVTSHAVAAVLAVFMGGLALGSWLLGRAGDEARSPLRLYGWLELGIALFGATSPLTLDGMLDLYVELRRSGVGESAGFPLVRVALAALALLGPTTLMGATLPILVRGACRTPERIAREAGLLYGINTLGAVAGVLAAAFFLVEHLGVRASCFAAAGLNVVAGLGAFALARGEAQHERVEAREEPPAGDRGLARAVLLAFGASGFLALAYEVLWTRYLVYVVGENSVYAFSSMLAAFLLGIALGSFLAALIADRTRDLVALFGGVLVLVGAAAVTTVSLMHVVIEADWLRGGAGFWSTRANAFARCLVVLLVPTTLSGSTFAIVARLYARSPETLGRDAGRAYAANTVGAILGSLAGGFLVLPWLGLRYGLIALSGVQVLVGLGLLLKARPGGRAVKTAVATGTVAIAAFAGLRWSKSGPELLGDVLQGDKLLYYADGPESSVAIGERWGSGDRYLIVDGDGQAGTDPSMQLHLRLLGHLPLLFHPEPKEVLVVAFGAGITTGCAAQHPIERLDLVELSRTVVAGAEHFAPFNHDPLNDEKVRLIHDDGRNFLLATERTYDVITSDPIDPDDRGVTSLYCKEYYELVRERLNEGGVACQWITTQYDPDEYRMLVRTFQSVFDHTSIWHADFTTVVVGTKGAPRAGMEDLRARLEDPLVNASLGEVGIDSAEALLSLMLAGPDEVRGWLEGGGPLNTDDRPRIEYAGPRQDTEGGERALWTELLALRDADHGDWVAGWGPLDSVACAEDRVRMDRLCERAELEWPQPFAEGLDDGPQRDSAVLENAPLEEEVSRELLDLTWEVLGSDASGVHLLLAGLVRAEPAPEASEQDRNHYSTSLAAGLAAFGAGELEMARFELEVVAADVPGAVRPALLVAACHDLGGEPVRALEELLWLDSDWLGTWSNVPDLALHAFAQVLRTMEREPERARELGEKLLELTPYEDGPGDLERGWNEPGAPVRFHPRPSPGEADDVDAWRLWWHDARWDLVAHEGRFVWDWFGD